MRLRFVENRHLPEEVVYALRDVLKVADNVKCENLHHSKSHQHEAGEMCKAEYHIHRQAYIVREYLKFLDKIGVKSDTEG